MSRRAGGELIVRDSGSYGGSLTITKSITISADGVTATLSSPGTITIDAVGAVVALRGLHLQGAGAVFGGGIIGVAIGNAAKVRIERCTIERFAYYGINLVAYDAELFVADSVVRSNGGNGLFIEVRSKLTVDNSRFEDNGNVGIDLQQVEAVISRTVASRNGLYGIAGGGSMTVISTIAAQNGYFGFYTLGQMTLEFSAATGNDQAGLRVGPSGKARISNSTFTNNGIGLENGGGIIETRQNNTVRDNGTNVVGPLTTIPGT